MALAMSRPIVGEREWRDSDLKKINRTLEKINITLEKICDNLIKINKGE